MFRERALLRRIKLNMNLILMKQKIYSNNNKISCNLIIIIIIIKKIYLFKLKLMNKAKLLFILTEVNPKEMVIRKNIIAM